MSSTTLEIIQGLNQAAANAYDGAHDERYVRDGELKKVGLNRENGCPLTDSRVIDGFFVKFYGNKMCVGYQSDILLKDVYAGDFENEPDSGIFSLMHYRENEERMGTVGIWNIVQDKFL